MSNAGGILLVLLYAITALLAVGHALLNKRDPRSTWAWIAVCLLAPLAGPLLYYLIGIERIHRHARTLLAGDNGAPVTPASPVVPDLPGVAPQEVRELVRIGGAMSGRPLMAGNRVNPLHNGEEAYPAMLEAIAQARERVWLSTYIFEGAGIGEQFAKALAAAQARGAQVRVLLDGVGDLYYRPRGSALLRRHGVRVARFHVPRRFLRLPHLNLRNHRKLLVADSSCAFVGGMNVGNYHLVRRRLNPTTDLHFKVQGPAVAQLAEVFAGDWRGNTGETLDRGDATAPAAGSAFCRALDDGPDEMLDRIELTLLGALANAHRSVRIVTPYFLPTPALEGALQACALRGVSVEIVLPRRSNLPWVDWAARHALIELLRHPVRVFWQPAPFAHTKMFLVDGYYAQIGSANLDARSLRLNFELMLEVYDPEFVARLDRHFLNVRARSQVVTPTELATASLPARLRNALFWLFSPYL